MAGFFQHQDNTCHNCSCHPVGSWSKICDPNGKCKCKPGVMGDKCDICAPNFYKLSNEGCKQCTCNEAGTLKDSICHPVTGKCMCKSNVEGDQCDKCKAGFFNLDASLPAGCLPCFCNDHSSECVSSRNHVAIELETVFDQDDLFDWTAVKADGESASLTTDTLNKGIIAYSNFEDIWFSAPSRHLFLKKI